MPGWFSENAPPRPPLGVPCLLRRGNVYLRYFRSGQGPQVLLLPALARSPSDFNELVEFLCGRAFQTLALEGRGVGESRAPLRPRATLSDLAADVAAVAWRQWRSRPCDRTWLGESGRAGLCGGVSADGPERRIDCLWR
jgi:predicted alpha/beta hydrolase